MFASTANTDTQLQDVSDLDNDDRKLGNSWEELATKTATAKTTL
jgi:hypothetical protein